MSLLLAAQGAPSVTLVRDESIPVDSQATVVTLQLIVSIPVESLTSLVISVSIALESGAGQRQDGSIPVESIVGRRIDVAIPIDDIGALRHDETIPVESGMRLAATESIPIDALRTASPSECVDEFNFWFDGAVILSGGESGDFASWFYGRPVLEQCFPRFITLTLNQGIAVDSLHGLARADAIPVEDLQGLVYDVEIPIDVQGAVQATLTRDAIIPVESITSVVLDETIPVENLGTLVRDEEIPIDTQFFAITRDEEIPVEALTGVTRDDEIPIDSTAVAVLALLRDEAIPVESSTAPVTPSDLLVFYGAGAPWPPSWLVRAPLLNRTQHCAVLYLGGTSWSTFTGSAPPPRPSRMVKPVKPPRRIRKPHPTPAHPGYVRAGHSSIIWVGGRSTEATRIDRAAVMKQDEEDFMTLLPLL